MSGRSTTEEMVKKVVEEINNPKTTVLRRIVGTTTTGEEEKKRKEKWNDTPSKKNEKVTGEILSIGESPAGKSSDFARKARWKRTPESGYPS